MIFLFYFPSCVLCQHAVGMNYLESLASSTTEPFIATNGFICVYDVRAELKVTAADMYSTSETWKVKSAQGDGVMRSDQELNLREGGVSIYIRAVLRKNIVSKQSMRMSQDVHKRRN